MSVEIPAYEADTQYRTHTIKSVVDRGEGDYRWEVEVDGGFWIGVAAEPVVPKEGDTIRLYGKGFGFAVRGITINDVVVFYRTEAEEEVHQKESLYGKDCADLIRRWDDGRAWSIELGGLGPGYEQCIQIMGFEMLRYLVENKVEIDWADTDSVKAAFDAAEASIKGIIQQLGVSGGQFGAARNLAAVFYRNGPIKAMEMAKEQEAKTIQVGPNFPSLDTLKAAATA